MSPKKEPDPASKKSQQDDDQPHISRVDLRQQILGALRARGISGSDASAFVEQLNQESKDALSQRSTLQVPFNVREGFLEKSMTTWVDKMFDHFNNYVYEFNPAVRGSELEVLFSRPEIVTEQVISNRYRQSEKPAQLFVGRLATRNWTLFVRGQKEKIEAFIVPSDRVIGLTRSQTTYRPYLLLESVFSTGKVYWKQNGMFVRLERLESISRELFTALIRFSRGELTEENVLATGNANVPVMAAPAPQAEVLDSGTRKRSEFEEQFFKEAEAEYKRREEEAKRRQEEAKESDQESAKQEDQEISSEESKTGEEETARQVQSQSGRYRGKDAAKQAAGSAKGQAAQARSSDNTRSPEEMKPTEKLHVVPEKPKTFESKRFASVFEDSESQEEAEITEVFRAIADLAAGELAPSNTLPDAADISANPKASNIGFSPPAPEQAGQTPPAAPEEKSGHPDTHHHQLPPHGPHREPHAGYPHHAVTEEYSFPSVPQHQKDMAAPVSSPSQNAGISSMAQQVETDVSLACDILLKSVDREIQNLTVAGTEAFKALDTEKVQNSMKQMLKLKVFRQKVLTLISDWTAANQED